MGVGVSGWRLARAVARHGSLGVVSGVASDVLLSRRLQDGDPGGELRRALSRFPDPGVQRRILDGHFRAGGRPPGEPYRMLPLPSLPLDRERQELAAAGAFIEVSLSREGHDGPVGFNLLEKMQLHTLPALYGAMLAGVHYVIMGAGIPRQIPGVLDRLARNEPAELSLTVEGALPGDDFQIRFVPRELMAGDVPPPPRPRFLAVVSSVVLAQTLLRRSTGPLQGFIVENPTAGGHNAPPRGPERRTTRGEPIYGPRDVVETEAIRALGLPFWMAGSWAEPERLREALEAGAAGIQVGTAFAFCRESGLRQDLKEALLTRVREGRAEVMTDALASPTGFPFKVAELEGTLSEPEVYDARPRICDLGALRTPYRREDGTLGYRCPAEPVEAFVRKGGRAEDAVGRKCLCNGLPASVGLGQVRSFGVEPPILTSGDDLKRLGRLLRDGRMDYSAEDVLRYLEGA